MTGCFEIARWIRDGAVASTALGTKHGQEMARGDVVAVIASVPSCCAARLLICCEMYPVIPHGTALDGDGCRCFSAVLVTFS